MRYKHDTMLPMGAFKRQGSVVGGRSLRVHGSDGWPGYEDPRYSSSQGQWVTYNSDAGAVWEPLTVAAPLGQYVTTNADAGGQWVDYSAQESAAVAAQQEADRQAQLQAAAAYVAANPLPISGDQIATPYGNQNISYFNPIPGQPISGSTPTQLRDPQSGTLVYLSNPSDPYSYTYENTGIPAIGGTLEQQAAMYRPLQQNGVFGTIGGDFLDAVKDPYFRNFAIAAASMAAAAALAPAAGGSIGGSATNPLAGDIAAMIGADQAALGAGGLGAGGVGSGGFGSTLTALGPTSAAAAQGFGSIGSSLAAAAAPAASTIGGLLSKGADVLAGPYGSLIKGGLTLGGLAAAAALKPKTDSSGTATQSGLSANELNAIVSLMPSMVGQYTAQAGQGGTGQGSPSYTPAMGEAIAQLFPNFSLPTSGPYYGAGRFGEGYTQNAPTITV